MRTLSADEFKKKFGEEQYNAFSVPTPTKTEGSLGSRLSSKVQDRFSSASSAIQGTGEYAGGSDVRRGVEAVSKVSGLVPELAYETLPEPVRQAGEKVGEVVNQGFNFLTDKVASTKLFREIGELEAQGYLTKENAPELFAVKEALKTASAGGKIAGDVLTTAGMAKGAQQTAQAAGNTVKAGGEAIKTATAGLDAKLKTILGAKADELRRTNLRLTPVQVEKLGGKIDGVVDYLKQNKISGTPEQQYQMVKKHYNGMESKVQEALDLSKRNYSKQELIDFTKKIPDDYATEFNSPNVYDALVSKSDSLVNFINKNFPNGMSASKFNELKRAYMKNAFNKGGDAVINEANQAIGDSIYSKILKDVPTLQPLNRQYQVVLLTRKLLGKALGRNELGMTGNIISSGVGAAVGSAVGGPFGTAIGAAAGPSIAKKLFGTAGRTQAAEALEAIAP